MTNLSLKMYLYFQFCVSISQICDNGYTVEFHKHTCTVKSAKGDIMLTRLREQTHTNLIEMMIILLLLHFLLQ